jgi:hypothetical protein
VKVRIVWVQDMMFDVYHDDEVIEHIWMENDGRWYFAPSLMLRIAALDACYAQADAQDAKLAAAQADWIGDDGEEAAEAAMEMDMLRKAALSRGQP